MLEGYEEVLRPSEYANQNFPQKVAEGLLLLLLGQGEVLHPSEYANQNFPQKVAEGLLLLLLGQQQVPEGAEVPGSPYEKLGQELPNSTPWCRQQPVGWELLRFVAQEDSSSPQANSQP